MRWLRGVRAAKRHPCRGLNAGSMRVGGRLRRGSEGDAERRLGVRGSSFFWGGSQLASFQRRCRGFLRVGVDEPMTSAQGPRHAHHSRRRFRGWGGKARIDGRGEVLRSTMRGTAGLLVYSLYDEHVHDTFGMESIIP